MSINGLPLAGWEETSTWGIEQGSFYAQLTSNGVSDDDGPQVWISPPRYTLRDIFDLVDAITTATGSSVDEVVLAMSRGVGSEDRGAVEQLAGRQVSTSPPYDQ